MDERAIEKAVDALVADYERQSCHLTIAQVEGTLARRKLVADDVVEVWIALRQRGITPEGDPERGYLPRRVRAAASRDDSSLDLLRLYLRQIGQTPLLTAQDEIELGRRICFGQQSQALLDVDLTGPPTLDEPSRANHRAIARRGRTAWKQLVVANLRLVVSIAKNNRRPTGLDLLDLIQEGNLGLLRAAEKFDYTLGFKFSTYATWWIRQAILRGIADRGRAIRIPVHVGETVARINATKRRLLGELDREPTLREVADRLDLKLDYVAFLVSANQEVVSLDQPVRSEDADGNELIDFIDQISFDDPADVAVRAGLQDAFDALLANELSERQQKVIELRFGLEDGQVQTLEEIGSVFGVTRERIRQIEVKSLERLRLRQHDYGLDDFADRVPPRIVDLVDSDSECERENLETIVASENEVPADA